MATTDAAIARARRLTSAPMSRGGLEPTEELIEYLATWGARTDDVLERVRAETSMMPRAQMQVAPDQGALMEFVVRLMGAKDALEVGTFTGYSAICIARGLAEGGRLTCLELDDDFADIAQRNLEAAGVADRVEIRRGSAAESLEAMPARPTFDFAFIDADKTGYPEYYELVLARMRRGGVVLLDNMLQGGSVVAPDGESARVIDALNRRIHDDERVDMAMTVAADGLTFVRVR
jgi:caffeoyl-CoA O-methyltransferase